MDDIPCSIEGRQYKSFVPCPSDPKQPARATVLCNVNEIAEAIASAIGDNGGGLVFDLKVVNIVAGIPLTVVTDEMDNICDFEILDQNGNKIELGTKKTAPTTIEICSNVNLDNIQVYFTGDQ